MITSSLPDPNTQAAFYRGVFLKRFGAWVVDSFLIALISAVIATLPLFILWFYFPLVFLAVSLVYRIGTLSAYSATPGMRLFNIELRNHHGKYLDNSEAALHTVGFLLTTAFILPLIISIFTILLSQKGQALHDMVLDVVAINRPGRH